MDLDTRVRTEPALYDYFRHVCPNYRILSDPSKPVPFGPTIHNPRNNHNPIHNRTHILSSHSGTSRSRRETSGAVTRGKLKRLFKSGVGLSVNRPSVRMRSARPPPGACRTACPTPPATDRPGRDGLPLSHVSVAALPGAATFCRLGARRAAPAVPQPGEWVRDAASAVDCLDGRRSPERTPQPVTWDVARRFPQQLRARPPNRRP